MFSSKLTKTLDKISKFIGELETGIALNNTVVEAKREEVQKINQSIDTVNKQTTIAQNLLNKLQ